MFAMAMALIVVDIVLRLVMIERKSAAKWIDVQSGAAEAETETERLIAPTTENGSSYEEVETGHISPQQSNGKAAEDGQPNPSRRSMPGIMRLMGSLTILVVLQATLVEAMTYSSFDSVLTTRSPNQYSHGLTLANAGPPPLRKIHIRHGPHGHRPVLHPALHPLLLLNHNRLCSRPLRESPNRLDGIHPRRPSPLTPASSY